MTRISSGKWIYVVYLPINWGGFGALRLVFWQLSCSLTCTQLTKCLGCFWCCCCYWITCPCLKRGLPGRLILATPAAAAVLSPPSLFSPNPTSSWCKVETPLCTSAEPLWKIITCLTGSSTLKLLQFVSLSAQSWKNNERIFHCLVELGQHLILRHMNQHCGNEHRDTAWHGEERCTNSKARKVTYARQAVILEAGLSDLLGFLPTWILLDPMSSIPQSLEV